MTNYLLLNHEQHKNLSINTEHSIEMGDGVNFVMTFPFEFRNVQAHYPIFFQKNSETGRFFPVALLGFETGENLFLSKQGWQAAYVPAMVRRQPFLIGYQSDESNPKQKEAMVTIDMDNPRVLVDSDQGEALFMEHGGSSEYLQEVTQTLELIHQAHEHSDKFVDALLEHELIEQFSLNIDLIDGSGHQLLGYYTINEDKAQKLDGKTLALFNSKGFLMPLYMALASHSCIRGLVGLKNQSLA